MYTEKQLKTNKTKTFVFSFDEERENRHNF